MIATQVAYDATSPELFAATPSQPAQRTLLWRALQASWDASLSDVRTAFLHAEVPSNEHLYLILPANEAPPNTYWRVLRAVHGFRKSPHYWQEHLAKAPTA